MHADEDEEVAALKGLQAQVQGTGARASKGIALQGPAPAPRARTGEARAPATRVGLKADQTQILNSLSPSITVHPCSMALPPNSAKSAKTPKSLQSNSTAEPETQSGLSPTPGTA